MEKTNLNALQAAVDAADLCAAGKVLSEAYGSYAVVDANVFKAEEYYPFSVSVPAVITLDCDLPLDDVLSAVYKLYGNAAKILAPKKTHKKQSAIAVVLPQDCRYDFTSLLNIMKKLRSPDGCAWDLAQTHESIRYSAVEEAYELLDAIENGNDADIAEEAGDLLLQTIFHCRIAQEEGRFNIYDVIDSLCNKLVFRHSHIFGEDSAKDKEQALNFWSENKNKEKHFNNYSDTLLAVPRAFPALMRAEKLQKRAAKSGFDFENYKGALSKLYEEIGELVEALGGAETAEGAQSLAHVREECGDILFAATNVIRLLGLESEPCLNQSSEKFIKRFCGMEKLAESEGKSLKGMHIDEMEKYYQRVRLSAKHTDHIIGNQTEK